MMMKKVAITGERQAEIVEVPVPEPKEDWALVKVHAAPMCTEYKSFLTGNGGLMGHEAAGEVVDIAQPCRVDIGERVVVQPLLGCGRCEHCLSGDYIYCQNMYDYREFTGTDEDNSTMAQYILKPSWLLSPIPDGISWEHASLANCALGPTFGALERMGVSAFDTVLITGLGPVGLGGVVNGLFRGAEIIATDLEPWRRKRAEKLGADLVLDAGKEDLLAEIYEFTGGRGVDAAVDCSGSEKGQRLCLDAVRRRGQFTFVGESSAEFKIRVSQDMLRKGLTVHGSWHYNLSFFPKIMQVIRGFPRIDGLISHVFSLDSIQEAFETCASHRSAKVILKPWA